MNVLFVGSGNKTNGKPSVLIKNQAISLDKKGCNIDFYLIHGKGFWGYLKNIPSLRKKIKSKKYDVIHAHYSLCGFVLTLSSLFISSSKKIVSLMGSDSQVSGINRILIRIFYRLFWDATIVKTEKMKNSLGIKKSYVVPNGVNLEILKSNIRPLKNTVLFASDPSRKSKNFPLAQSALNFLKNLNNTDIHLKIAFNLSHQEIIKEIQSSSCVLITSLWEGSPNIVKEAMACNRPIVSTQVGDVSWLLENVSGCFIVKSDAKSVGEGIISALKFSAQNQETNGRKKIVDLGLDSASIADKIITIYKN
ncbi:MAG: glycosyltransferase family 4 protein [Bacteroidota bacterium]